MANRTGYLVSPTGGGGYDVLTTEFVFDELEHEPVSTGTVTYPTTFGSVDGAAYFIGGNYYFVPDDPFSSAPSEVGSSIDVDLPIYGTSGSETVNAPDGDGYIIYSGPDTSGSGTGSDTINGGAGDDHIFYGDGNDTVNAGDGDDIIGGFNSNSSGTNTLDGGAGDDQILGGAGNDTVYGGTGDDSLAGGAGTDTLYGGEGSDLFMVTDDHDRTDLIGGETGSDYDAVAFANFISASPVVVTFTSDEAGHYSFTQTDGFGTFSEIEAVYGTDQSDQLNASMSSLSQELFGNGGDDYVQGGSAGDVLYGGDGNDTIIGEGYTASGPNLIVNGSFEDTTGMTATGFGYQGRGVAPGWTDENGYDIDFHGDGRNGINATDGTYWLDTEGGAGEQLRVGQDVAGITEGTTYLVRLDIADFTTADDGTARDNEVQIVWNGEIIATINPPDGVWDTFEFVVVGGSGDGTNRLEFDGTGAADAEGASIDNVQMYEAVPTADGDDILVGGAGDDTIAGGDGDDWIIGNAGANTLSGGDGDDTFEVVTADGGTDRITGGEDAETLGDEMRFTGADAVRISFDTLESGSYAAGSASGTFSQIERFEGTGAQDVIDLTGVAGPLTITFDGDASGTISDGTRTVSFSGFEEILGSDQDDIIDARQTTAGVVLHGRGGDDQIIGGTGDDELTGGSGDDTFVLGETMGNDTITGGESGETVGDRLDASSRTTGLNVVLTGDEAGTATGGGQTTSFSEIETYDLTAGDDTFDASGDATGVTAAGGDGDDVFYSGAGDDAFDGGSGADSFHIDETDGSDVVDGGDGDDRLAFSDGSTQGVTVTWTGADAGTWDFDGTASDGSFSRVERVEGTSSNDTMNAAAASDGTDIHAGDGDDTVTGSANDDTLDGGAGDDVIAAGGGNDTITGGDGDDTYVFEDGDGSNVITDFDMGDDDLDGFTNDQLDLSGLTDADGETVNTWDMVVSDDGSGNSVLTFDDGTSVTLMGVAPATLDGSTFYSMGVPCFTAGTRIATPNGPRRVETLGEGDLVCTLNGGDMPVIWAGQSRLDRGVLDQRPDLAPVKIKPGALGNDRTLTVSPHHRIALKDDAGGWAGFVPARWLAEDGDGRFRVAKGKREVVYVHLMLPKHAVILGDGAASESFYPGPEALIALDRATRNALFDRFPNLAAIATDADAERVYGPLALPELSRDEMLPFLLERSVA